MIDWYWGYTISPEMAGEPNLYCDAIGKID
jgi:hypothetical protein